MDKKSIVDSLVSAIVNNSNIEAEPDDEILFNGVADVSSNGKDIIVVFENGKKYRVSVGEM